MQRNDLAILKGLVAVAWADGVFVERERALIQALLTAFDITPDVQAEVWAYAEQERSLADVPVDELGPDDCRHLLQHAVLLAMMDGEYHDDEKALIEELRVMLKVPTGEARDIYAAAEKRADQMLQLM